MRPTVPAGSRGPASLLFALLLILLGSASPAAALPSGHKWFVLPVQYRVFQHASVRGITDFQGVALPRIQSSFAAWTKSKVTGTKWEVTYLGTFNTPGDTTAVNGTDRLNRVLWLGGAQWRHGAGTLALTTTTFLVGTGEIVDTDMEVNDDLPWAVDGTATSYDLESILTHEAGHFLGLDHSPNATDVMFRSFVPGERRSVLSQTDISDVRTVYPPPPPADQKLPQGSPCAVSNECTAGLLCLGPVGSTSKFCTVDCTAGAACPTGLSCLGDSRGGSNKACMYPPGDPELCRYCSTGAQCDSGLCVTNGKNNWCTIACLDANNCGSGYTCEAVQGIGKVCVPVSPCPGQCTTPAQCALGYTCTGGTCEATGNPGDRCELSAFCKPCSVCIGSTQAAYCRPCCDGQGGTGACKSCAAVSCGAQLCDQVTGSTDKVCVPQGQGLCQPCDATYRCADGFSCVGGRCHVPCSQAQPGTCAACGSNGLCACAGEVALPGDPCGIRVTGEFAACANGLHCVGSPTYCRKPCTAGDNKSCGLGEVCAKVDGVDVCVQGTAPGTRCNPCVNGACADPLLTCFEGRCYEGCTTTAPVCGSACVDQILGKGLCACEDQRSGLNQPCGNLTTEVRACQFGLTCLEGACRSDCQLGSPINMCAIGTSCRFSAGRTYCLPVADGDGGIADTGGDNTSGGGTGRTTGAGKSGSAGCGCSSPSGPLELLGGLWAFLLWARARNRRGGRARGASLADAGPGARRVP